MKKYFFLGLIIALFGCDKNEEPILTNKGNLWMPNPVAIIAEDQVQLRWTGGVYLHALNFPGVYVEPDFFEIYISKDDYPNFVKLVKLKNNHMHEYTITGLTEEKPVYFYVTSMKEGYEKIITDTIMAVPGKETETVVLFSKGSGGSPTTVSRAHNISKIAYVDQGYYWENGENCCMAVSILISNIDGTEAELLDNFCYEPDWSPDDKKIAFRTEKGEVNTDSGMPSQIAIYDCDSKVITKLTNDAANNYTPEFSMNGELIMYQSSRGVSGDKTNIWLVDLNTLEHRQLTDLATAGFVSFGKTSWIDDESYLFHAQQSNYKNNIFRSSINSPAIEKVFDSYWNDYCPVMSPDGKKIAFFSDRSGSSEVWLYDLVTSKFRQLTGFTEESYINGWWSKLEWIDNQTIAYTMGDRKYVIQKTE